MNTKQISINRENNMDNIKDNFSQMTKHGEYKGNNEIHPIWTKLFRNDVISDECLEDRVD